MPLIKNKNMTATLFSIINRIGTENYMTLRQLLELDSIGWSVGNHTNTSPDMTSLDATGQQAELQGGYDALAGYGMQNAAIHVAYPGGLNNEDTATAMAATTPVMLTGRSVVPGPFVLSEANLFLLKGTQIAASTTSLAQAKAKIDTLISGANTMEIFVFHEIVPSPSDDLDWATSDFSDLLDYIENKGIITLNIEEIYAATLGAMTISHW